MKIARKLLVLTACVGACWFAGTALAATDTQAAIHSAEAEAKTEKKDLILKGDAKCTGCHDEADDSQPGMLELRPSVLSIGKTKHGTQADSRTPTCTDCHGDSDKHMTYKGSGKPPKPDILFTRNTPTPVDIRNDRCLSCHQGGKRINWQSSTHAARDVACVSCHQVHARKDKVRDRFTQTEVCFNCHKEQRAQMARTNHHPVPEGQMACSSCHDPHNDNPKALIKSSTTDTCYTCHMEKRGPFLHNHPPVQEDCGICHQPHGTTTASLLKQRPPFLCAECHSNGHIMGPANLLGIPATGIPPTVAAGGATVGRACLNCHVNIHGSNSTQAAGNRARRFVR